MAFSASWIAMCIMAYIRDSWNASPHPAMAALPAFAFQSVTACARAREDHPRLRERKQAQMPSVNVLIAPPFGGVASCLDRFEYIVIRHESAATCCSTCGGQMRVVMRLWTANRAFVD